MGVRGFPDFIKKECPGAIKTLSDRFVSLSGKTVVMDGALITHQLHSEKLHCKYRHILGWYRIIRELRENNVLAICAFEAFERNPAKRPVSSSPKFRQWRTLQECNKGTRQYSTLDLSRSLSSPCDDPVIPQIEAAENHDDANSKRPTSATYEESKKLLRALGVPCKNPTGIFEGEAFASSIVRHGYADYVATTDTDVLVYEVPMIQNIADRSKPLVVTSGADVRVLLRLDRASFVDFALLLGTDFTDRIKHVGPVHAIRLIRKYGSIERVIKSMPQRPLPESYLARVKEARQTFGTLAPLPHWKRLQVREPDLEQVSRIMKGYGLSWALQQEWDGRKWV